MTNPQQSAEFKNQLDVVTSSPPRVGGVALSAEVVRKTEPGEGTRVVDYTPQSLRDSPPTLVGQFFFLLLIS